MDLQQLLNGALGQQAQQLISNQLGLDEQSSKSALDLALPTLLNALSNNASNEQGAASLFNALQTKHDGNGLNDLGALAQQAWAEKGNLS